MTFQLVQQSAQLSLKKYQDIRNRSLSICAPLQVEDYVPQPTLDVSPPKWHLGHTTWFFENFLLVPYLEGYQCFNSSFNYFFNSYYESQGPRVHRSQRGNMTRPALQEILDFRQYVDEHLLQLLGLRGEEAAIQHLLEVGLQHEEQHQELLMTDLKYILGHNPLFPVYKTAANNHSPANLSAGQFLPVVEGIYQIGFDGAGFCWDNELGRHKSYLHPFSIYNRLVSNGEFLEFMEDGGYETFQWWLSEGWDWVQQQEIKAPLYWHFVDGTWQEYTLHQGLSPLVLEAPVTHISYFEAEAYARWRGYRLPTEFEWEVACRQYAPAAPSSANFFEQAQWHPGAATDGHLQFHGDCWEWTGSAYLPYPLYQPFEGALGEYNGKFMSNQMVLRGGSCATPAKHARISYRNFFHTDKRWQFTGIRLAKNS